MTRGLPSQHPLAIISQKYKDERGSFNEPNLKRSAMSHYLEKRTKRIVDKRRVTTDIRLIQEETGRKNRGKRDFIIIIM